MLILWMLNVCNINKAVVTGVTHCLQPELRGREFVMGHQSTKGLSPLSTQGGFMKVSWTQPPALAPLLTRFPKGTQMVNTQLPRQNYKPPPLCRFHLLAQWKRARRDCRSLGPHQHTNKGKWCRTGMHYPFKALLTHASGLHYHLWSLHHGVL